MRAGLASSYDRSGNDDDYGNYQIPAGRYIGQKPAVVLDVPGPGVLTRFWMPHAVASQGVKIRVLVDGQTRLDTTSDAWLGGRCGYFQEPLVETLVGGQVSYEPIVFGKSLRIVTETPKGVDHYYQYNYLRLPKGTDVTPFTARLNEGRHRVRDAVVRMMSKVGQNPAGSCPRAKSLTVAERVVPAGAGCRVMAVGRGRNDPGPAPEDAR